MREIDLSSYDVKVKVVKDNELVTEERPYNVRESLCELLFVRSQRVSAVEAIKREKIARKIEECEGDIFLLEENDWEKMRDAVNSLEQVGRNDVEFVSRVLDAKEIEVQKHT